MNIYNEHQISTTFTPNSFISLEAHAHHARALNAAPGVLATPVERPLVDELQSVASAATLPPDIRMSLGRYKRLTLAPPLIPLTQTTETTIGATPSQLAEHIRNVTTAFYTPTPLSIVSATDLGSVLAAAATAPAVALAVAESRLTLAPVPCIAVLVFPSLISGALGAFYLDLLNAGAEAVAAFGALLVSPVTKIVAGGATRLAVLSKALAGAVPVNLVDVLADSEGCDLLTHSIGASTRLPDLSVVAKLPWELSAGVIGAAGASTIITNHDDPSLATPAFGVSNSAQIQQGINIHSLHGVLQPDLRPANPNLAICLHELALLAWRRAPNSDPLTIANTQAAVAAVGAGEWFAGVLAAGKLAEGVGAGVGAAAAGVLAQLPARSGRLENSGSLLGSISSLSVSIDDSFGSLLFQDTPPPSPAPSLASAPAPAPEQSTHLARKWPVVTALLLWRSAQSYLLDLPPALVLPDAWILQLGTMTTQTPGQTDDLEIRHLILDLGLALEVAGIVGSPQNRSSTIPPSSSAPASRPSSAPPARPPAAPARARPRSFTPGPRPLAPCVTIPVTTILRTLFEAAGGVPAPYRSSAEHAAGRVALMMDSLVHTISCVLAVPAGHTQSAWLAGAGAAAWAAGAAAATGASVSTVEYGSTIYVYNSARSVLIPSKRLDPPPLLTNLPNPLPPSLPPAKPGSGVDSVSALLRLLPGDRDPELESLLEVHEDHELCALLDAIPGANNFVSHSSYAATRGAVTTPVIVGALHRDTEVVRGEAVSGALALAGRATPAVLAAK